MTKVLSCYYICLLFFSSAIFIPSGRVATLSELLWIVGVNDFILKFVSVIIKIFVILLPSTILQHRKRVSFKLGMFFKMFNDGLDLNLDGFRVWEVRNFIIEGNCLVMNYIYIFTKNKKYPLSVILYNS